MSHTDLSSCRPEPREARVEGSPHSHRAPALALLLALIAIAPIAAAAATTGERLYMTHCSSCHGERIQGSESAPPLVGKSAADIHLMLDTGRMPAPDPAVNEIHKKPQFTEPQIRSIIAYVQSFSPQADRALPHVAPGNVRHGRALFSENCAQCHGASGNGASVGYGNVAPSLTHDSAMQVAEAIRAGPGVMPRFGTDVLSDRDVNDIAEYVRHPPVDSGGTPLAHIGPVAEGFIAWLFGIGLLTLFVRSIGTTK